METENRQFRATDRPSTSGRGGRSFPIGRLLLYYVGLVAIAALLVTLFPSFRDVLIAPIAVAPIGDVDKLVTGGRPMSIEGAIPWPGVFGRGALALMAMLWALAMALPVAWVLKHTRHLRYDPSLVQALIVLPIVVSGVVLVVKNSLALAFALAGIVAGVRFRQKLDEPEQAVYVLLALGIGLAAGVQALDIAMVMSLVFTLVVLILWRYDIGDIFAGGRGAKLTIGDPRLLRRTEADAHRQTGELASASASGMKPDGILIIRAPNPEAARRPIEVVLGRMASHWRMSEPVTDRSGTPARIEIPLELKPKIEPSELIAELDARLLDHIAAAEFIPYGNTSNAD